MSLDAQPVAGEAIPLGARSGQSNGRSLAVAIGAAYLVRLLVALLASYPAVAHVSASGIVEFDSGDGKLFEPGGLYLLEVLVRERAALIALAAPTAWLLVIGALALVVPEWLLLRALGARSPEPPQRILSRLVALALGSWAARALLAFAAGALATTARRFLVSARDERLPLLAASAVLLLGLVGWACLGVLHDLAKIEVTLRGAAPLGALEGALRTARRHALPLAARYGAWTLATAAVMAAGTAAAASFDVTAGASSAALAALVVHQGTVLAQVGLHAGWLASALGVARHAPGQRGRPQADAFL